MAQGDERSLLERAKSGDNEALLELFQGSLDLITATASRMLGNEADVKDVVNETFLKALRAIAGFREECAFSTWLYRIAWRAAIDKLRDRDDQHISTSEMESYDEDIAEKPENPQAGISRRNRGVDNYSWFQALENERAVSKHAEDIMYKALEKLTPRQTKIINLRREGVPLLEIAAILGVGIGVVYTANKDFARSCETVREELSVLRKPVPARRSP